MKINHSEFTQLLLQWYLQNGREMPWRGEKDVYKIWLSEVMLQQTQVKTVIPYYKKWILKYPTVHSVSIANENEILKLWEGLGYYARARNFHKACQIIMEVHQSEIPLNEKFKDLPGVGEYIYSAVMSIANNQCIPVIDGNVKRVVARVLTLNDSPDKCISTIKEFLNALIQFSKPGDFNQAMMDLGSTLCKPKNPLCDICPISHFCGSFKSNSIDQYPIKKVKPNRPHYNIAVGVIWRDGKILISKRKSSGFLGGLWEFPGGKVIENESLKDCVKREVLEELGIIVTIGGHIKTIKHEYTHFKITMSAFHCYYQSGEPQSLECEDFNFILPDEIDRLPFPKANHKIFDKIPKTEPCFAI